MLKEFLSHRLAYLTLIIGLIFFSIMFFFVWPDREVAKYLILILSVFYILWGILVHTKSSKPTLRIVLEYISIAMLAAASLYILIL